MFYLVLNSSCAVPRTHWVFNRHMNEPQPLEAAALSPATQLFITRKPTPLAIGCFTPVRLTYWNFPPAYRPPDPLLEENSERPRNGKAGSFLTKRHKLESRSGCAVRVRVTKGPSSWRWEVPESKRIQPLNGSGDSMVLFHGLIESKINKLIIMGNLWVPL